MRPASQEFREVVRRNPQNFEALNDLGTVLKSLSRFDEAIVYLRQAVALQPDRAEIHNNLGNALLEAGETVEALAELQHAVSMRTRLRRALPGAWQFAGFRLEKFPRPSIRFGALCRSIRSITRCTALC